MLYAISKCIWALLQMPHGDDAESYRQSGFKLEIFSSIQTVARHMRRISYINNVSELMQELQQPQGGINQAS